MFTYTVLDKGVVMKIIINLLENLLKRRLILKNTRLYNNYPRKLFNYKSTDDIFYKNLN